MNIFKLILTLLFLSLYSYSFGKKSLCSSENFIYSNNWENESVVEIIVRDGTYNPCLPWPPSNSQNYTQGTDFTARIAWHPGIQSLPGFDLPEMVLYAYYENFENVVGVSEPFIFSHQFPQPSTGYISSDNTQQIEITNFEYFEFDCQDQTYFNVNFDVTLAAFIDGEYVRYDKMRHNLFPLHIFDLGTVIVNEYQSFCCEEQVSNFLYGSDFENGEVLFQSGDIDQGRVYPNPTLGEIYINLEDIKCENEINIIIMDVLGNVIANRKVRKGIFNEMDEISVNLSDEDTGVYLIQIFDGKNRGIFRNKVLLIN